jgi:hypothetical protein
VDASFTFRAKTTPDSPTLKIVTRWSVLDAPMPTRPRGAPRSIRSDSPTLEIAASGRTVPLSNTATPAAFARSTP